MMHFLHNRKLLVLAILAAVLLPGCGTAMSKTLPRQDWNGHDYEQHYGYGHPFSGVRTDTAGLGCPLLLPLYPLMVVDLPLSLAADVLLLPVDLLVTPKGPFDPGRCGM